MFGFIYIFSPIKLAYYPPWFTYHGPIPARINECSGRGKQCSLTLWVLVIEFQEFGYQHWQLLSVTKMLFESLSGFRRICYIVGLAVCYYLVFSWYIMGNSLQCTEHYAPCRVTIVQCTAKSAILHLVPRNVTKTTAACFTVNQIVV